MDMQSAISAVVEKRDLSANDMTSVMRTIMTGEATPAQIAGFLVGLRMKGETIDEIAAAATVMRELAEHVEVNAEYLVDTCGTGGDAAGTFNISTTSAFVVAAAGGHVAKHGNRSVSSKSGSADVLEAAGVKLDLSPKQVAECVEKIGVGFMFAPMHHSAMKYAIGPRREMGVRTLFNLLGPLTNPAGAPNQVIGVFAREWIKPMAEALEKLGSHHVMVVHADDGLDEISINSPTHVAELKHGEVLVYTITPEQFGISTADISGLTVNSVEQSLDIMKDVLHGHLGLASNIVILNAGAAIYTAGLEESLHAGIQHAREIILSGKAIRKLDALVEMTNSFS